MKTEVDMDETPGFARNLLREEILKVVSPLSMVNVDQLMDVLDSLGVDKCEDMDLLVETDLLGILKLVHCRKLLRHFQGRTNPSISTPPLLARKEVYGQLLGYRVTPAYRYERDPHHEQITGSPSYFSAPDSSSSFSTPRTLERDVAFSSEEPSIRTQSALVGLPDRMFQNIPTTSSLPVNSVSSTSTTLQKNCEEHTQNEGSILPCSVLNVAEPGLRVLQSFSLGENSFNKNSQEITVLGSCEQANLARELQNFVPRSISSSPLSAVSLSAGAKTVCEQSRKSNDQRLPTVSVSADGIGAKAVCMQSKTWNDQSGPRRGRVSKKYAKRATFSSEEPSIRTQSTLVGLSDRMFQNIPTSPLPVNSVSSTSTTLQRNCEEHTPIEGSILPCSVGNVAESGLRARQSFSLGETSFNQKSQEITILGSCEQANLAREIQNCVPGSISSLPLPTVSLSAGDIGAKTVCEQSRTSNEQRLPTVSISADGIGAKAVCMQPKTLNDQNKPCHGSVSKKIAKRATETVFRNWKLPLENLPDDIQQILKNNQSLNQTQIFEMAKVISADMLKEISNARTVDVEWVSQIVFRDYPDSFKGAKYGKIPGTGYEPFKRCLYTTLNNMGYKKRNLKKVPIQETSRNTSVMDSELNDSKTSVLVPVPSLLENNEMDICVLLQKLPSDAINIQDFKATKESSQSVGKVPLAYLDSITDALEATHPLKNYKFPIESMPAPIVRKLNRGSNVELQTRKKVTRILVTNVSNLLKCKPSKKELKVVAACAIRKYPQLLGLSRSSCLSTVKKTFEFYVSKLSNRVHHTFSPRYANSTMVHNQTLNDSSSTSTPGLTDFTNYQLPLDDLPYMVKNKLKKGEHLGEHFRIHLSSVIANDFLKAARQPTKAELQEVVQTIVNAYPDSLKELKDGEVVGSGYKSFLRLIISRCRRSNRPTRETSKRPFSFTTEGSEEMSDSSDLDNHEESTIPYEGSRNSVENRTPELQSFKSQQEDIKRKLGTKTIMENWPSLFTKDEFLFHTKMLLGGCLKTFLQKSFSNKKQEVYTFFIDMKLKSNFFRKILLYLESCVYENSFDLSMRGMILLIADYFGENPSQLFCLCQEASRIGDSESQKTQPYIIVFGESILSADSFSVCLMGGAKFERDDSFVDVFSIYMSSYFVFHVPYPEALENTLDFIQRYFLEMNERTDIPAKPMLEKVAKLLREIELHSGTRTEATM